MKPTKLFKVVICKCGEIASHRQVKDYSDCDYESDKKLSNKEVLKAIEQGNISSDYCFVCASCVDSPTMQECANEMLYM